MFRACGTDADGAINEHVRRYEHGISAASHDVATAAATVWNGMAVISL